MNWEELDSKLSDYIDQEKNPDPDGLFDHFIKNQVWAAVEKKTSTKKRFQYHQLAAVLAAVFFAIASILIGHSFKQRNEIAALEIKLKKAQFAQANLKSIEIKEKEKLVFKEKLIYKDRIVYLQPSAVSIAVQKDSLTSSVLQSQPLMAVCNQQAISKDSIQNQPDDDEHLWQAAGKAGQKVYHFEFGTPNLVDGKVQRTWTMTKKIEL